MALSEWSQEQEAGMRNQLAVLERAIELRRRSAEQLAQRAAVLLTASSLLVGLLNANRPTASDPLLRRVLAVTALVSLLLALGLGIAAVFPRKLEDDDIDAVGAQEISLTFLIERRRSELTANHRMADAIQTRRLLVRLGALALGIGGGLTAALAVTAILGITAIPGL